VINIVTDVSKGVISGFFYLQFPSKTEFNVIYRNMFFLCFVDRASRYIRIMKTNLMHYLSSVYFVN